MRKTQVPKAQNLGTIYKWSWVEAVLYHALRSWGVQADGLPRLKQAFSAQ